MAEEPTGFLGRWSRRKTDMLQGKPLAEPAAPPKIAPAIVPVAPPAALATDPGQALTPATPTAEASEKLLSLDDVKALTQDSDFKPFMAQNVGADVRNAAMKKLFTDPHYNVMDGLDIYISDYSIADPIPESMLRQMVGTKLLKIFDDEEDEGEKTPEAPVLATAEVGMVEVVEDCQTAAVLPAEESLGHAVLPRSGTDPVSALSASQEADEQENSLAPAADSSSKFDQVALSTKEAKAALKIVD